MQKKGGSALLTFIKIAAVMKLAGFAAFLCWNAKTSRRREMIRKIIYPKAGL